MIIGDIYNKSAWVDLADFSTNSGFSVSGGKIESIPNSGETNYIRFAPTALDHMEFKVSAKWITDAASGNIVKIYMLSRNTNIPESTALYMIGSGANKGKIVAAYTYPSSGTVMSTAALNPAVGDVITIGMRKTTPDGSVGVFTGFASLNGGTEIDVDIPASWNGCYPSVYGTANTYEIQNITFSSDMQKYPDFAAIGDSITYGGSSTDHRNRWIEKIGAFSASGGPGDKTSDYLARLTDITTIIKPRKCFILGGTNDVGVLTNSAYIANLQSMVASIEASGLTKAVVLVPIPRNGADIASMRTLIISTFPTKYIDLYTALLGSGTSMNATYNSGDGIHPNDAGHQQMATTIMASSLYAMTPNVAADQPNIVVPKQSITFDDAGITTDNTAIIYKVGSPLISYVPGRSINGISGFDADGGYYWVAKEDVDLTGVLLPPAF